MLKIKKLFILSNVSYASFPVTEKTQTEIIERPSKIPLADNAKILILSLSSMPFGLIASALAVLVKGSLVTMFFALIFLLAIIFSSLN